MSADTQAVPAEARPRERSYADALARRVLRVEGADPRALMSMRGSLVLSAVRCILTYVLIPVLLPLAGWLAPISAPLSLTLTVTALVMAVVSLRRVWLANWDRRWAYTAFAVTVIAVLSVLIVLDARAVIGA